MPFLFEASFYVLVMAGVLFGLPMFLTYERFFGIPRTTLLLALMGFYSLLLLAKPAFFPLWTVWIAVFGFVGWLRWVRDGHREPLWEPLMSWPVIAILVLSFLPFILRWEPPGAEGIIQGVWARQIFETRVVGSDFPSPTGIAAIRSGGLGVPSIVAISHMGAWARIERVLNFLNCLGFALFAFSLASVMMTWFSRQAANLAVLMICLVYSFPILFLNWSGGAELIGLTAGLCWLELSKSIRIRENSPFELGIYILALVFTSFASTAGFVASTLAVLPSIIQSAYRSEKPKAAFGQLGTVAGISVVLMLFSPMVREAIGSPQVGLSDWQRSLAPELFSGRWFVGQVWRQLAHWVSGPALLVGFILFASSYIVERFGKFFVTSATLCSVGLIIYLSCRLGFIPLGHLLHPHHGALLIVVGLSFPLAWFVEMFLSQPSWSFRVVSGLIFGVMFAITVPQWIRSFGPQQSRLTANDLKAMEYIEHFLPEDQCVGIRRAGAGEWLPVLTGQCVEDIGESSQWVYLTALETDRYLPDYEAVYSKNAMVLRRVNPDVK